MGEDEPYWWLRQYHHQVELLVEYTGDTAPFIEDVTSLRTTLSTDPREVSATITDVNCTGGDAGVAEALLCYSFNCGDVECVEMTAGSDVYSASIPGGVGGDVIDWYIEATDVEGLSGTTPTWSYGIFEKTADILWVNNSSVASYWGYGGTTILVYFFGTAYYPPDAWIVFNDGPVPDELWDLYDTIAWDEGGYPATVINFDKLGEWLESGTAANKKCFYMASQDGAWEWGDPAGGPVDFGPGDVPYDYLGIDDILVQDVGTDDCYPVNAIEGDPISGPIFDYAQVAGQMYYSPDYEIGYTNWIDDMAAAPHAVVCFTNGVTGEAVGVHTDGCSWKTTFLTFDAPSLDFGEPCPTDWILFSGAPMVVGQAFDWCAAPSVNLSLLSREVHVCDADADFSGNVALADKCEGGPDYIILKPDSTHDVCAYISGACEVLDVEALHFVIAWDGGQQFLYDVTMDGTCMDSTGWDLKYHIYDNYPDLSFAEIWMIGGGNALEPLAEDKCILLLSFDTYDETDFAAENFPGAVDTVAFVSAEFNEGGAVATHDFYKYFNVPPYVTWDGEDVGDEITVIVQESHSYSWIFDYHDVDGDLIHAWSEIVYEPLNCIVPPAMVGPDTVCADGQMEVTWHPMKLDECDSVVVDFIAISTMPDTLFDTLRVHFIVDDCAYQFAWMTPPPHWDNPGENPPLDPDTANAFRVHACGEYEIPVGIHFDYPYVLAEPIYSIYLELITTSGWACPLRLAMRV
jgi:hypothetical protein